MSNVTYSNDDLSKTSSGTGHQWRVDLPDSEFVSFPRRFLPEILNKPPNVASGDHYQTTYRAVHNFKCILQDSRDETPFIKPPAHYKVHYNLDLHDKLQSESLRRPLTMGNQASETRDEFVSKAKPFESNKFSEISGILLKDHLKDASPSSKSEKIGLPSALMASNNSICILNDPYVTTYQKEHKAYRPDEIMKYNWDPVMVQPQESPMRDKSFFKSSTKIRRLPRSADFIPHSGLKTSYNENFEALSDMQTSEGPHHLMTSVISTSETPNPTYFVPHLHKTEYSTIGSKCRDII